MRDGYPGDDVDELPADEDRDRQVSREYVGIAEHRPRLIGSACSVTRTQLPDLEGRRLLVGLNRGALTVDESRLDSVLERTEGVTASFPEELLDTRNAMTRALLGGSR